MYQFWLPKTPHAFNIVLLITSFRGASIIFYHLSIEPFNIIKSQFSEVTILVRIQKVFKKGNGCWGESFGVHVMHGFVFFFHFHSGKNTCLFTPLMFIKITLSLFQCFRSVSWTHKFKDKTTAVSCCPEEVNYSKIQTTCFMW